MVHAQSDGPSRHMDDQCLCPFWCSGRRNLNTHFLSREATSGFYRLLIQTYGVLTTTRVVVTTVLSRCNSSEHSEFLRGLALSDVALDSQYGNQPIADPDSISLPPLEAKSAVY